MKHSLKTVALGLLLIGLTACDSSSDFPDLRGRYAGQRIREGSPAEPLIAQVPSAKKSGAMAFFEFDLVSATIPTVSERIEVQFFQEHKVILKFPSISHSPIPLKVKGSCAQGTLSEKTISLCWSKTKIDLSVLENSPSPNLQLTLARSADLPHEVPGEPQHEYTLNEIMARAKFNSYSVSQEAERVFQAKKGVTAALGNLLPHFNTRDLFPVILGTGSLGLIEIVGDLLPFIFPSNWYQWRASKAAHRAERSSFASLRGNHMNQIEGLFYVLHRDVMVRDLVVQHLNALTSIHQLVIKRERYGQLPLGSSDRFSLSILEIEQDLEQMDLLLSQEFTSLSHGVALPPSGGVQALAKLTFSDPTNLKPIAITQVLPQATQVSYELTTLNELIQAAKNLKSEFAFGFLDPLSSSTFGFGYAATLKISKSRIKEIESKRDETASLIEKQAVDTVGQFNRAIQSYQTATQGLTKSQKYLATLNQRLRLGDDSISEDGFIEDLRETSRQILKFQASQLTSIHALQVAQSKIDRLLLQGLYSDLEVALPVE